MGALYDLPLKDHFINKNYDKGRRSKITEIVIHHNAGHGVDPYNTWQTREASAHFQVWGNGKVDYIVHIADTAWHAHEANDKSIGIEHENSKTGGEWPISDAGLHASAKLVGYLCALKDLGSPKLGKNVTYHNKVESDGVGVDSGTACPGPYFIKILKNPDHWYWKEARAAYNARSDDAPAKPAAPKPSAPKPKPGKKTIAQIAKEVIRGDWGNGPYRRKKLTNAGYNADAVQREVNKQL